LPQIKPLQIFALVVFGFIFSSNVTATTVSELADKTANYALSTYKNDMVDALAQMVTYKTVAIEGISAAENPEHIAFKADLKRQALALGLDFVDHGYIVIIGLGQSTERVGLITHGDIQPADPNKWKKSPFELDMHSEPGKLIARGTEDNKGPIATALFAMKAIKDMKIPLKKRIELYVYMAEESDWQPLEKYIKNNSLPKTNITIDAEYPVVTAEKGYGTLKIAFNKRAVNSISPYIKQFSGGFFASQIPEDASATIANADLTLLQQLLNKAKNYTTVSFDFELKNNQLTINTLGLSAHSSKPAQGYNAITYLADLLSLRQWNNNGAGTLVNFINDNIGLGLEGKKFGDIAYHDDFMGPMTVSPTVIKQHLDNLELNINIRRPRGKTNQQLTAEVNQAIARWKLKNMADITELSHSIDDPFVQNSASHIDTLLTVFSHYSGVKNPQPIAIGGATNSRLFPNAISFGPAMPNTKYTGHSEHEFITMAQFELNLLMYTAALVELTK
jgi:dipeptidase D